MPSALMDGSLMAICLNYLAHRCSEHELQPRFIFKAASVQNRKLIEAQGFNLRSLSILFSLIFVSCRRCLQDPTKSSEESPFQPEPHRSFISIHLMKKLWAFGEFRQIILVIIIIIIIIKSSLSSYSSSTLPQHHVNGHQ